MNKFMFEKLGVIAECASQYKFLILSVLAFAVLIVFYYPTSSLSLGAFHNDDALLMGRMDAISSFHDVLNFVFSFEAHKFRPVAYLQWAIEHLFFAHHYNGYVLYNIILVVALNYVFLLCLKEAGFVVSAVLSLVLVTSKLFTYSVWNITGSFETLAAVFFLLIVYYVFSTRNVSRSKLVFLGLLLIFTSERYLPFLVALPVIYRYVNAKEKLILSIWRGAKYSLVIVMAYFMFRYSCGVPIIVGTQTDNVVESFSVIRFISNGIKAYLEMFGFSLGPTYLTGFEPATWVPFDALMNDVVFIQGFVLGVLLFVVSLYLFIFKCFVSKNDVIGLNIIGLLLIMAASITFRLELRWLLASYLMLLLFFSSRWVSQGCEGGGSKGLGKALFFSFVVLSLSYNVYHAIFFRRGLYFAQALHDSSIFASLLVLFGSVPS